MKKPPTTDAARIIEWLNTGWSVVVDKPPAEPVKEPGTEPPPKIPLK